jgi:hypothetical protein
VASFEPPPNIWIYENYLWAKEKIPGSNNIPDLQGVDSEKIGFLRLAYNPTQSIKPDHVASEANARLEKDSTKSKIIGVVRRGEASNEWTVYYVKL